MIRKAHRTEEHPASTVVTVGDVRFGADPLPVIAGPCTIESEEQITNLAEVVAAAGARMLRGNSVATMANAPYGFHSLGLDGVKMLSEAGRSVGLPVVTQIAESREAEAVSGLVDMLEIGSGNMQNFELLRAVGQTGLPVLLKRSPSATFDEWLWAAEYILAEGNDQVVLCERGIRAFERTDTLDIAAVPAVRETSHLPVVVFPSHAVSDRQSIGPLSLAAQGVGADGLVIEVHPDPAKAATNVLGQLDPTGFDGLMAALGINRLRGQVDLIDRDIVRLLARRLQITSAIGRVKAARGMPVFVPSREEELLAVIREEARLQGLADGFIDQVFELILANSRDSQRRDRGEE